ncbi:hypothetical protein [Gracilimonas sp.]|uniref:hypothetical protein n=1 Tax=Gracilimonas sp. TaxID=1974203 RepID=UPI0032EC9F04
MNDVFYILIRNAKYAKGYSHLSLYAPIWLVLLSVHVNAQNVQSTPMLDLPAISGEQVRTATDFLIKTRSLDYEARQRAAAEWILEGQIPSFLRELVPVSFKNTNNEKAVILVTCDYMSIGTEGDFIRMPLSLPAARKIASSLGMYLPTSVMVDSIYSKAHVKLQPIPMQPGEQMRSNDYYRRHQQMIEKQLKGVEKGRLVSGHKKDVVITNRLIEQIGRLAIYGWHYAVDDPIQPLSLVHSEDYEDYSHGLRLIYPTAKVNGEAVELKKLINRPEWNMIFTKEGVINIESLSHGE